MNPKRILCSTDCLAATVTALVLVLLLPESVPTLLARDLFAASMSVLSITFSVFFAALAVIISSSDNDFVRFLEVDGAYSRIISSFRFTLEAIFVALIASVVLYTLAAIQAASDCEDQPKWYIVAFGPLFFYSLFAAMGVARDSITYAKYRARFLATRKGPEQCKAEHDDLSQG